MSAFADQVKDLWNDMNWRERALVFFIYPVTIVFVVFAISCAAMQAASEPTNDEARPSGCPVCVQIREYVNKHVTE